MLWSTMLILVYKIQDSLNARPSKPGTLHGTPRTGSKQIRSILCSTDEKAFGHCKAISILTMLQARTTCILLLEKGFREILSRLL